MKYGVLEFGKFGLWKEPKNSTLTVQLQIYLLDVLVGDDLHPRCIQSRATSKKHRIGSHLYHPWRTARLMMTNENYFMNRAQPTILSVMARRHSVVPRQSTNAVSACRSGEKTCDLQNGNFDMHALLHFVDCVVLTNGQPLGQNPKARCRV